MDEVHIANLVYQCAAHFDGGDLASAAALLSNARVKLCKEEDEYLTHEELLSQWERKIILYPDGTPKTKHVITNPIISVNRDEGIATCWSCYTVTQATDSLPLQIIASGRYHDEFLRVGSQWQFSFRDYSLLDATGDMSHHIREYATPEKHNRPLENKNGKQSLTRARILAAAQQAFSTVGYSEAGMRKIAEMVDLSPTILFRNFSTKAALFEEALIDAIKDPKLPSMNKQRFGRDVAELLADTDKHICPHSMTILATGNEEAREITTRVLQEYALKPMAEWLGPPNAESRARQIFSLLAGFALYYSRFKDANCAGGDPYMVEWLATSVQAIVDQS